MQLIKSILLLHCGCSLKTGGSSHPLLQHTLPTTTQLHKQCI